MHKCTPDQSRANGLKGGRPATPLPPAVAVDLVARAAAGDPLGRGKHYNDLTPSQAEARLAAKAGLTITDFRERVSAKVEILVTRLADKIAEDIEAGTIPPRDRPIAFGIMLDKHADLTGSKVAPVLHQTNIQINGVSRQEALGALANRFLPTSHSNNARALPSMPVVSQLLATETQSAKVAQVVDTSLVDDQVADSQQATDCGSTT